MDRKIYFGFIMLGVAVALGGLCTQVFKQPTLEGADNGGVTLIEKGDTGVAQVGGAFKLMDHHGVVRRDIDFKGKLMLVYFGYSYCPDICPTALLNITDALDELGDQAKQVQPIFITVDPERDTVKNLASYMQNYPENFVALTGDAQAIKAAMASYHVFAAKVDREDTSDYLVDHSSIIYLMDRQGRYVANFHHGSPPNQIVEAIKKVL